MDLLLRRIDFLEGYVKFYKAEIKQMKETMNHLHLVHARERKEFQTCEERIFKSIMDSASVPLPCLQCSDGTVKDSGRNFHCDVCGFTLNKRKYSCKWLTRMQ
jgi:hypothetical protein